MASRNDVDRRRSDVRLASVSVRLPASLLQETSPHAKGEQLRMCCLSG